MITRRNFLKTMLAACAAPAIVKASSLMPIFVPKQELVYPEFKIVESVTGRLGTSFAHMDEYAFYKPAVGEICLNRLDNKLHIYTGVSWRQIA